MTSYIIAIMSFVFAMMFGVNTALAGGASDSTGEGFHCYQFFTLPDGKFAQAMTNDSDPAVVVEKFFEFNDKYVGKELGVLTVAVGNVPQCTAVVCPCFSTADIENFDPPADRCTITPNVARAANSESDKDSAEIAITKDGCQLTIDGVREEDISNLTPGEIDSCVTAVSSSSICAP